LRFWRLATGQVRMVGLFAPEDGEYLMSTYDAITGPRRGGVRFVDKAQAAWAKRVQDDPRTTDQLTADAFLALIKLGVKADPKRSAGGRSPEVHMVTIRPTSATPTNTTPTEAASTGAEPAGLVADAGADVGAEAPALGSTVMLPTGPARLTFIEEFNGAALDRKVRAEMQLELKRLQHEVGITFAFAALFHPGFRHAGPTRAELGIPTVFNFLGPLCNPARPEASAVGVANLEKVPLFVGVFQTRGATALGFRGDDGLDELSTTGHSHIWEVSRGSVTEHDLDPSDLGLKRATLDQLRGGDAVHNAGVARRTLAGEGGPVRDIVLLNAAAGLIAWELAHDHTTGEQDIRARFRDKIAVAADAIDTGAATAKLEAWVAATRS